MKKFLAMVVIAGSLVACNNDGTSTENVKDSIENTADSLQNRVEDKADSTVEVIENKADSAKEAVDNLNNKRDSLNKTKN